MALTSRDIVPLSHVRAHLSDLADEVNAGAEKIITKNGESYVALIGAAQLDYYHRLAAERRQVEMLEEVERGLDDVEAGQVREARTALQELKRRRVRRTRR